ncbi:MAG: hypothetical protein PHD67_09280 [Oscillospiraceae bacterium]|nr:hypothetical protein [Oscillospiraceae bacterium]
MTADDVGKMTFPHRPRFTLETLKQVRIATGDGESTIAAYTYTHGGQTFTRYEDIEGLTHAEREAALAFMLKYSKGQTIDRKGKPRGRAVTGTRPYTARQQTAPPPLDLEKVEFEPVDIDSLTETDPAALLDAGSDQSAPDGAGAE